MGKYNHQFSEPLANDDHVSFFKAIQVEVYIEYDLSEDRIVVDNETLKISTPKHSWDYATFFHAAPSDIFKHFIWLVEFKVENFAEGRDHE